MYEAYSVDFFMTTCNRCNKSTVFEGEWIQIGQRDSIGYKCPHCSEITDSKWSFAHQSIVRLFEKGQEIKKLNYR